MTYKLIIRPEAERDLAEIFAWYENRRKGLGYDFLLQVEAGFNFIEKNPKIFPEIYRGARRYLIKRFPYKIYYRVDEDKVIILAVIYGGRDPNLIRKRLR